MIALPGLRNRRVVAQRSAGELDAMAAAGSLVAAALRAVRNAARPGVSTVLDEVVESVIRDGFAEIDPAAKHGRYAHALRILCLPVVIGWLLITVAVNIAAPRLDEVVKNHSVQLTPKDAPSLIAMKRTGNDFQQVDSDTTAMLMTEGQDKLGDAAHRYYDQIAAKLLRDPNPVEHVENFWGDRLTAAGSQSTDAKGACVRLNHRGNQGDSMVNTSVDAVYKIVASVPAPPGIKAYLTGPGALAADRREYGDRSLHKITLVTIVIIWVMLFIPYRKISTALLMLVAILVGLGAARGTMATLGHYPSSGSSRSRRICL